MVPEDRAKIMDQAEEFFREICKKNPDFQVEVLYADVVFGMGSALAWLRIEAATI